MNSISFAFMKKCNAKCSYCCQKENNKDFSYDEKKTYKNFVKIFSYLKRKKILKDGELIAFLGGEISIFNDDFLKKILKRTKKFNKLFLTNGLVRNNLLEECKNATFFEHIIEWKKTLIVTKKSNLYVCLLEPGDLSDVKFFKKINQSIGSNNIIFKPITINNKYLKYSKEEYYYLIKNNVCQENKIEIDCVEKKIKRCCGNNSDSNIISFDEFYKLNDEELKKFMTPLNSNKEQVCQECRKYKISDLDPEIQEDILKNNYWL